MSRQRERILCVDDEPAVVSGLARMLRRHYDVTTAGSGLSGLAIIDNEGPFAAIISDLQMPGINGITFLARARTVAPATTRVLLTGRADLEVALAAVNTGQVFRFLCKPAAHDDLLNALQAAVTQYLLVTAERELLEKTLKGSIEALVDALSLANPAAFARATRIKGIVAEIAEEFGAKDIWLFEVAALLSQIGAVTLPPSVIDKLHSGGHLSKEELQLADRLPELAEHVLARIPRMEPVRAAILAQRAIPGEIEGPEDLARIDAIPLGGRLLRIALDVDELRSRGATRSETVEILRQRPGTYDGRLIDALYQTDHDATAQSLQEISLDQVRTGMTMAQDVRDSSGVLLIGRGQHVTQSMLELIRNRAHRGRIAGRVLVTQQQGPAVDPTPDAHPVH
jgi:response regulator RpfG family c-di-GMP phosphodiesterase